uniref:Uncharacterized protein n=1 Tax=Anguilla anguilla TaxID=7936 RepID=A0A0E9PT93_ANGAN
MVQHAGNVSQRAVDRGDPQVGRSRIEHHCEGLDRSAQSDLPVILGIKVVLQGLWSRGVAGWESQVVLQGLISHQQVLRAPS